MTAVVCCYVSEEFLRRRMDDATGVPLSLPGFQRSLWEECELGINSSMARLGFLLC